MSVVGPRPLLVKYLPLYNEHQARRHKTFVLPGAGVDVEYFAYTEYPADTVF